MMNGLANAWTQYPNLILAYAATWIIHIGYLISLGIRSRKLSREERELNLPAAATGKKK